MRRTKCCGRGFNLTGDGEPQKINALAVNANFFSLLGIKPALGRSFLPTEDQPGEGKVAILSHELWQQRYGGQPDILNRHILLNGDGFTVVGVMPTNFQFVEAHIGLWVPAGFTPAELNMRDNHFLVVVARLKSGTPISEAQADISSISGRIASDNPEQAKDLKGVVLPLREQLVGEIRQPLLILLGAVAIVLLIAYANVASLLIARATNRNKEIAMRIALGAGRSRIVRQLITESVLLALAGGLGGVVFAIWSFGFLRGLIPESMTRSTSLNLDSRVLGFTILISAATGLVFGLVPAIRTSGLDLNQALKQGNSRTSTSSGSGTLRKALVIGEVALALVLLIGAGLLMQTVLHLRGQYGFLKSEQILTVRTTLAENKYGEPGKRNVFYEQVLSRVSALPGVLSVGYSTSVPLQWKGGSNNFQTEDPRPPGVILNAVHRQVSVSYLQTMGYALRDGRLFDNSDNHDSLPVVVVNETLARQSWPGQVAIGKRLNFGPTNPNNPWRTVVGVVADVRQVGIDQPVRPEMYIPFQQISTYPFFAPRDLVLRTTGDPLTLAAAVRNEIKAVDPDQPVSNVATMSELLGEETAPKSIGMMLVTAFALLALFLATLGIYGVLSFMVAQQTQEIGLRMALGARPTDLLRSTVGRGMQLAVVGLAIGLAASYLLTRLVSSLLFGVTATDPLTYVSVSVVLLIAAGVASFVPARRAMKVDPMVALRGE